MTSRSDLDGRRRIAAMFASIGRIARGEDYTIAAEASRLCRRAVSRGVTLTYEQVHAAASYGVTDERGDDDLAWRQTWRERRAELPYGHALNSLKSMIRYAREDNK